MKDKEFLKWLVETGRQENTANSVVSRVKRIEEVYPDLDSRFEDNTINTLLGVFVYTKDDEARHREPLHKVKIEGNYLNGTRTLKDALAKYVEFCREGKSRVINPTVESAPKAEPKLPLSHSVGIYGLPEFCDWMQSEGMSRGTCNSYSSHLNTLDDKINGIVASQLSLAHVSDLLSKGNVPAAFVQLDMMDEQVSEYMASPKIPEREKSGFNDRRSALRKYRQFLEETLEDLPDEEELEEATEVLSPQLPASKGFEIPEGTLVKYPIADIEKNFAFRLKTQNRMSNHKDIFYPVGIIGKLFNYSQRSAKKIGQPNGDYDWFKNWINNCVDDINIIVSEDGETIQLSSISELSIGVGYVTVLQNGKDAPSEVFTETDKDVERKIPMMVSRLRDIHIDHTPLMADILTENIDSLPALMSLSDIIKKTANKGRIDINPKNFGKISKKLFADAELVESQLLPLIPDLKDELQILHGKSTLKLMTGKLNLKKK